ncbi:MAG: hypothetical protein ACRETW_02895 [Stenotrophobium sp.]
MKSQAITQDMELLDISDMARIFRTTEAAIRMAIWRQRQYGSDPGFPAPLLLRRRYRWLKATVVAQLETRTTNMSVSSVLTKRAGRPRGGQPPTIESDLAEFYREDGRKRTP